MNMLNDLLANKTIFFNYMKEKYEVIYKSNIFLRDLIYAAQSFYQKKGIKLTVPQAEKLVLDFTAELEKSGELQFTQKNTWKVNFSQEPVVNEVATANVE